MNHGCPRSWEGKMFRGIILLGLFICILAGPSSAMQWDREEAENALGLAREQRGQLTDAQSSNRSDYLRCIRLYKRVWLSDPHYGGCDDAVYEAALLYQEMSEKFSAPEYAQEAADLLRFLLKDYNLSPFRRDARARLVTLNGPVPQPAQAPRTQVAAAQPSAEKTASRSSTMPLDVLPAARPADHAAAIPVPNKRPAVVQSIRHWSTGDRTRVMIDLDGPVQYQSGMISNPDRLYFDLSGAELDRGLFGKTITVGDALLKQIRTGQNKPDVARVVLDFGRPSQVSVSELSNPFRIVIDIRNSGAPESLASTGPAKPVPASGKRVNQTIPPNGTETVSARPDLPPVQKPQLPPQAKPKTAETSPVRKIPAAATPLPRPVETAALQKTPPLPSAQIPARAVPRSGKEPAASRTDAVVTGKTEPPLTPGPKPGEKVVIQIIPAVPPAAKSPDTAALQATVPLILARIPAEAPRTNGKETASLRSESVVAGKTQPPPPAAQKPASVTVSFPKSTAPAPSLQGGTAILANGSVPETSESTGRPKSPASAANGSLPSVIIPPLIDPAAKPLQTNEILPVPPRPAPEIREARREPPAEPSLRKTTPDKVTAADSTPNSARNRDIPPPAKSATPTSRGDMTLTRVLGLKVGRIVIDPGHGGHDTGTVGRNGLMEKDLVLDVALNLKRSLEERLDAQVLMTRSDDRFISLEERTAIANRHRSDLFISIHANASTSRSTSGVETYYLNFARTAADREIAARENATTLLNIGELQDLVRKIAMADKSTESRELAALLQRSLFSGSRGIFPKARNRGVRSAPFIVLIGAEMPAVLVEVAFISNPRDEKLLKKENSQQVLAKALLTGIEGYMKSLASYMADNHPGSN